MNRARAQKKDIVRKKRKKGLPLLFFAFVKDVASKLGSRFWILLLLLSFQALTDGLRMSAAFLLFPFIGISLDLGTAQLYLDRFFNWINLPYNLFSVSIFVSLTFLVHSLIIILIGWFSATCTQLYVFQWRKDLINAIGRAKWHYFIKTSHGKLHNVLSQETMSLEVAVRKLSASFSGLIISFTYIAIAFWMVPKGTLTLLFFGGILFLLNLLFIKGILTSSRKTIMGNAQMMGLANELLKNMKILKASAGFAQLEQAFSTQLASIMKYARRAFFSLSISQGISELLVVFVALATLVVVHNDTSTGEILALFTLLLRAFGKITTVLSSFQSSLVNLVSFEHVLGILEKTEQASEDIEKEHPATWNYAELKDMRFKNVSVKFDDQYILRNIRAHFTTGKVFAFVGASGAGKTTLVDTILRLVEIHSGRIDIDDKDLSDINLIDWRRSIGYVSQDTTFFHGTVRENIRWFHHKASDEDVENVAKLAHAHEFISTMEKGYDTLVGEMGMRLSGGQRQRLALARALIHDPKILILDEATSALDSNLEGQVMDAVYQQKAKRIVIIIAHRLSTVRNADWIFVLDAGQVVEQGSWAELSQSHGIFREMYEKQVS